MDDDSSTKFIGSLTKFLQSLCNGYVEFQRGVELVGHIYLNIDTGEKVDYILHEKVSKNDENSVTFVSNSFHALPQDKDKNKTPAGAPSKFVDSKVSSSDDDDDIMIVDQTESVPESTNIGTIPSRGLKRVASPSSGQRQTGGSSQHNQSSSSNAQSSPQRNRQQSGPAATVTSQSKSQENISMGEVKLEQISSDELLSLASQVGDTTSSHQAQGRGGGQGRVGRNSFPLNEASGQPWIKQEPLDDSQRGLDTGWSQSDSSNSGSNLYPVMMHQNPAAFTSSPVFPGFSSASCPSATATSRHGFGQSFPGTPGAGNAYANPMPGTSQNMGGMDPAVLPLIGVGYPHNILTTATIARPTTSRHTHRSRLYRQRLKQDPERYRLYLEKQLSHVRRYKAKKKKSACCNNHGWGMAGQNRSTLTLRGGHLPHLPSLSQIVQGMQKNAVCIGNASNKTQKDIATIFYRLRKETQEIIGETEDFEMRLLGSEALGLDPEIRKKQSDAEAARRYRQRIRQDPRKYYEYKLKDCMRKRRKRLEQLKQIFGVDV